MWLKMDKTNEITATTAEMQTVTVCKRFPVAVGSNYSTFLTVLGEYVSKIWSKLVATLSLAMELSRNTA